MNFYKDFIEKFSPYFFLLVISFALFARLLFGSADFYSGDASDLIPYFYGIKLFEYQSFQRFFELPLWNPHILLGQPTVGNVQYALFYPLNLFFLALPFFKALLISQIIHLLIAGFGQYFLAKHLGCGKQGSIISGCLFMLNGRILFYINAGWFSYYCSMCWIPLFIFFSLKMTEDKSLYSPLAVGSVFALMLLSGTPQYALLGFILFSLHVFIAIFFLMESSKERVLLFLRYLLAGIIGFLLSAVQVFPSIEQAALSTRVFFDPSDSGFHLHWNLQEWFRILFRPEFVKKDFFWELCAYIGIGGFFLSTIGFFAAARKNGSLFFIWGIFPILASMGAAFPPLHFLLMKMPGISMLSNPSRYLIYAISIACFAAGFGYRYIANNGSNKRMIVYYSVLFSALIFSGMLLFPLSDLSIFPNFRLAGVTLTFFALLFLFFRLKRPIFQVLIVLSLIIDPYLLSVDILKEYDFDRFQLPQKIITTLEKNPDYVRVAYIQSKELRGTRRTPLTDWVFIKHNISRAGGYEPLALLNSMQYLTKLEGAAPLSESMWAFYLWHYGNPLLINRTGISHILSIEPLSYPFLQQIAEDKISMPDFQGGNWNDKTIYLYRNINALPMAYFIGDRDGKYYRIDFVRNTPNTIDIEISVQQPGRVIIAESFHPGWKATDSWQNNIEIIPYLDAMISLKVPPGNHKLHLYFYPYSFEVGFMLSIAGLLLTLLLLFVQKRRL